MRRDALRTVLVAGKFDPLHNGHIDHIVKASRLGDILIVVVQTDDAIKNMKGICHVPFWARKKLIEGILKVYNINGYAVQGIDKDGKSAKSILKYRPDIFAKGGDRVEGNIPEEEVKACEEIGCKIIYGIGDLLNSSSRIMKKS